jgi:hypothetical protein
LTKYDVLASFGPQAVSNITAYQQRTRTRANWSFCKPTKNHPHLCLRRSPASGMWPRLSFRKQGAGTSTSSHKWETYRRRRFGRFSRRRATSILRSVRKERATQKIGQSAIGPPGWLEKGPSASLLVRHVSQRIRSSLAPSIQTLLKPTVCLPLMRRCTRSGRLVIRHWESVLVKK